MFTWSRPRWDLAAWSESMICAHAIASPLEAATFQRLVRHGLSTLSQRSIRAPIVFDFTGLEKKKKHFDLRNEFPREIGWGARKIIMSDAFERT